MIFEKFAHIFCYTTVMAQKILIANIKDADKDVKGYGVRKASRGILLWGDKITLLNVTKFNYHKLPGGGIEGGETTEEAFKREVLEETGCDSEIKDYGGIVVEYRDEFKLVQLSYVFFAEVIGEPGKVNFEQSEKDEGFVLKWVPVEKIEEVIGRDKPTNYEGNFIQRRDRAIIDFYKSRLRGK
jgi:8-oxo-dGTP diphosphatase